MNRKIIIKGDDFDREIFSFLKEIGADLPIDWDNEATDRVRSAVIEAFQKMRITLEIDDRPPSPSLALNKETIGGSDCITEQKLW